MTAREAVTVRARGLPPVRVRPRTTDVRVLQDVLEGRHLPPPGCVGPDARMIWDLGAYTGLTMVDLLERFPRARVVGVEMDPGSASLATTNSGPWGNRAEVIQAAVWPHEGSVQYRRWPGGEWGSSLTPRWESPLPDRTARAVGLNSLLADSAAVDFLKMNVEGAERELLTTQTEWASRVRCIHVEPHEPYDAAACASDLERLGFGIVRRNEFVVGLRVPS
jgi:FkbM family methyltransferase